MPAVHIKPKSGFTTTRTNTRTAARSTSACGFTDEVNARIAADAVAAHNALGCRGYSRVDFRITPEGEAYALEVNTAPGMTSTSLVPKAAKARGVAFGDFLSAVIRRSFSIKRG